MSLFQKVSDKTREGDKKNPVSSTRNGNAREGNSVEDMIKRTEGLPFRSFRLPDEVYNDFQRVIENIRIKAVEQSMQVIGIASAVPGQGSSTVAALLSLFMAGGKYKNTRSDSPDETVLTELDEGILLIDAQVRHPSLHSMFNLSVENGLYELIYGGFDPRDVMKELERYRLKLITVGRENGFRYTRTHLKEFKSFLDGMKRDQFEFVLIDIPPVLQYAEGLALSNLCDGIVFVVSAGQTRLGVVREARRLMYKAKVPVIGAVLNRREYFIPDRIYKMF